MQAEAHLLNATFEDSTWPDGGERVRGPFTDYYVASYACLDPLTGLFQGYAKVCARPPLNYWEADSELKFAGELATATPDEAMRAAEDIAHMQLANAGGLDGWRELRRIYVLGAPPLVGLPLA
jgi:hypothetical protein